MSDDLPVLVIDGRFDDGVENLRDHGPGGTESETASSWN